MTGIGNPNFKDPRAEVSWTQKMAAMAEGAMGSSSTHAPSSSAPTPDYQMRSNRDGPYGEAHKTPSYVPSIPGPWSSNPTAPPQSPPTSGGIVPDIPTISGGLGRAGAAASDGAYELTLVTSLCDSGGMKAAPPEDQLEEFLTAAPTLSPELVGSGLVSLINSDSWQSRAKALVVVGALAKRPGCSQHKDWWLANGAEDIQILAQTDSKATVKTQAIKTLRSLGISSTAPVSAASSTSKPASVSHARVAATAAPSMVSQTSLLDFDNDGPVPVAQVPAPALPAAPPPAAPAPPAADGGDSLFFGLSVGAPSAQPTVAHPHSAPPSVPAPSTAPHPASLFDFMDPVAPPAPSAAPPSASNPLDLNALYGPSSGPPPAPPQATLPQFAGLNLSVPVRMPVQGGYPPQGQGGYPPYPGYPTHPHGGYPPQPQQIGYPQAGGAGYPPQQQQVRTLPSSSHVLWQMYPPQPQYTPMVPSAMGQNNPQLGARKVIPDAGACLLLSSVASSPLPQRVASLFWRRVAERRRRGAPRTPSAS
jgi:hypothetical protein